MILLASDPGLANSAFVLFNSGCIVKSWTTTTKGSGHRVDFVKALQRADIQADHLAAAVERHMPGFVVIEGYEDIPGKKKRSVANRWTTPMVLAKMDSRLELLKNPTDPEGLETAYGIEVMWQMPSVVLHPQQLGGYKMHWAAGRTGLFPGDDLVTNDHERSAACHGIYALSMIARNQGL